MNDAEDLPPIFTAHLFAKLEGLLLDLLRSLDADEWERQTVAPRGKVRDVAAPLLDTQWRKLSVVRDESAAEAPGAVPGEDFVGFINRLNQEGVSVYRRLSPGVLIPLMEFASGESTRFHLA